MSADSPVPPSVSRRAATLASVPSQQRVNTFLRDSVYARRQHEPGICDFALGNPHQMPQAAYVEALADALTPRNERWFAYKTNEPDAQAAAAASLQRLLGMPFEPADIHLTTGGFTAIPLALKAVADPGDEVIFTLPPWFFYEPLTIEAGLVPVKIRCDPETFDVDLAALGAAITPRTRVVIVNTPNNPTGRIYPPSLLKDLADMLEGASRSNGRRVYLLSDEPYNRIVYDGARFHSPAEYYPYTLLAYSYGKTHLAPGQRIGYLALPPTMPDRGPLREALTALQMAMGWIYPNALLQHALPRLEEFSIDVGQLQQAFASGRIVVCAGFQGLDEDGNITTLGRGGSDTSAVALAAAVEADVCEILTDVDGVYTTDPRVVPSARKLDRIAHEEMLELASLGAKVLQIRSVEFAMKYDVPLHVRSSLNRNEGTWIVAEDKDMESVVVRGVALDRNEAKVTLTNCPDVPGTVASIFETLGDADIIVDMIIQNASREGHTDVTFTVPKDQLAKTEELLESIELLKAPDVHVLTDPAICKISIVGVGMRTHAGVAARAFAALAKERINIQMVATSEIKVSVVVEERYGELLQLDEADLGYRLVTTL